MRTGFDHVDKAISDAKARANQGFSGRLNYFTWKDGESIVLRFLTDEVLTVAFYEMVVDNQGKFKDFIVAPDLYADEPGWTGEDWVLKYGGKVHENGLSGPLIQPSPRIRSVGVAVLREEAPREVDGKTVMAYQDHLYEHNVSGDDFPARWFGIVKQSHQLFWNQMSGYHHEYGTICDRDFKVQRVGEKLDTTYRIVPLREDPDFEIKGLQEAYGYGRPSNKDDADRFLYCPQTLQEWAESHASEDRVKYWLCDPKDQAAAVATPAATPAANGYTPSGVDEFHKDTTQNPNPTADEAQAAPPPASDFSALRARLERHT